MSKPRDAANQPNPDPLDPSNLGMTLSPEMKGELASRVLARRSLIAFTNRFYPQYQAGWVHYDVARRLEKFSREVAEQKSPRLMLLMPPRHGKSELASIRFPAWHLGHNPQHEIINCGYNLDLPMRFSRKVKSIVQDPAYAPLFPNTALEPDSQATEAWLTTFGGGYTAAGVGGGITGKGAHVLIIDDPIKNQEEADSVTTRDGLWDWYWSTAYTRLAPGAGVLVIQCMTGDTMVLMADGTERRLDAVRADDVVATYENGQLTNARVAAWRSNGSDNILKITTKSGKIVRANGRHPFLATTTTGELKWIRARSLSTANKIVAVKGSEVSGQEWSVLTRGATSQLSAEGYVVSTTEGRNGPTGTGRRHTIQQLSESATSNTATASLSRTTTGSLQSKEEYVQSAEVPPLGTQSTGAQTCASTTATLQEKSAGSCATTATRESDILELSPSHLPLHDTSDFTLDEIVSIEVDGYEEVFDLQIDRTTNFIANGLVSHNTWWHDDDLAGRLQGLMHGNEESDQFYIVKYPMEAEADEYISPTGDIVRVPAGTCWPPVQPAQTELILPIAKKDSPHAPVPDNLSSTLPTSDDLSPIPPTSDEPTATPKKQIEEQLTAVDGTHLEPGFFASLKLLRRRGEPLHPERYNEKMMRAIKANQPPRVWSALYQQNPVPDEGVYFRKEYLRYEPVAPSPVSRNVYQAWDFAIGEKQHNDYTVGITLVQDERDYLHIVEVVRFKGDSFTIVEEILDAAVRWSSEPDVHLTLGVEDSQIWKAIKPLLSKRMGERSVYPSLEELRPLTDKLARARPLQGRMQQGRIYMLSEAPWRKDVETELLRFPAGAHDDIVDALAWAVHLCIGKTPRLGKTVKEPDSWRKKLGLLGLDGIGHMSA